MGESLAKGQLVVRAPLVSHWRPVLMLGRAWRRRSQRRRPLPLIGTTADDSVLFFWSARLSSPDSARARWWPQIVGQTSSNAAGACAALACSATLLWALPLLITGFLDEPLGCSAGAGRRLEPLNGVSMTGAAVLALAVLVFLANPPVPSPQTGRQRDPDRSVGRVHPRVGDRSRRRRDRLAHPAPRRQGGERAVSSAVLR